MTSVAKLTYYNGILWCATKTADGASVPAVRRADDGRLFARAMIRYDRRSGIMKPAPGASSRRSPNT
jgi:hypothetical protein